jgi:hypothetical protein
MSSETKAFWARILIPAGIGFTVPQAVLALSGHPLWWFLPIGPLIALTGVLLLYHPRSGSGGTT